MAIAPAFVTHPFAQTALAPLKLGFPRRALQGGRLLSKQFKILIVEDDALIAMELGERLDEMGYAVLGPAMTLAEAEAAAQGERPDAALLDANLAGHSSVGVAAALAARGVPVAFCTGYDEVRNLPAELKTAPVLTKPVSDDKLLAALKGMLGA